MTRIGIFVPELNRYDAVGNDVLGMHAALQAAGYDCHIFCQQNNTDQRGNIHLLADADILDDPSSIIIHHYALLTDYHDAIVKAKGTKILRFHNITPPHFFELHDPQAASRCLAGINQLQDSALAFDFIMPASQYNFQTICQLVDIPAARCFVCPPFHAIDRWDAVQSDHQFIPTLGSMPAQTTHFLSVGRLVPHKNHNLLFAAFALFLRQQPDSILHLVGHLPVGSYQEEIYNLLKFYHLEGRVIIYHQGLSEKKIKALYNLCDCYITTTLHEGFCLPLIEAMYFKLPIVALKAGAIPETLGQHGIILENKSPLEFKNAMAAALTPPNKEMLATLAHERYQDFQTTTITTRLLAILKEINN